MLIQKQLMHEITCCKAPPKQTSGGNQYNCMAQREEHEAAAGNPSVALCEAEGILNAAEIRPRNLDCAGMFPK